LSTALSMAMMSYLILCLALQPSGVVEAADEPAAVGAAAVGSVDVTSPNGGEMLRSGRTYLVTWQASGAAQQFRIQFSIDGGKTWVKVADGVVGSSYLCQVPTLNKNNKTSLVRIIAFDLSGERVDEDKSDSVFRIDVVRIIAPVAGDRLTVHTLVGIDWEINKTKTPVDKVLLHYTSDGGATWNWLATVTPQRRSLAWWVPKRPSSSCKIKVTLLDSSGGVIEYDRTNGFFSIVN
jgi:hypothetical protein